MSLTNAIDATEHLTLRELPAHVHVGPRTLMRSIYMFCVVCETIICASNLRSPPQAWSAHQQGEYQHV